MVSAEQDPESGKASCQNFWLYREIEKGGRKGGGEIHEILSFVLAARVCFWSWAWLEEESNREARRNEKVTR